MRKLLIALALVAPLANANEKPDLTATLLALAEEHSQGIVQADEVESLVSDSQSLLKRANAAWAAFQEQPEGEK